MKSFVLATLAASTMALSEIESAFFGYITQFQKSYSTTAEFEHRLRNFAVTHSQILSHNASESNFKLGHNHMSDWTTEEYKSILTYKADEFDTTGMTMHVGDDHEAIDWRQKGCVNPIQDQGQCGSCWAFSTTATMEGAYCAKSNELLKFSEQELVDCAKFTNHGCNGGLPSNALKWLESHGEMAETAYPYVSGKTGKRSADGCQYLEDNTTGVKATGTQMVAPESVDALKAALSEAPVSIAIQADQKVFQAYKTGIFDSEDCGDKLDHAVNLVGWGAEDDIEFWILRNSWNTVWGEEGYMRVKIVNGKGICGLAMQPVAATADKF